jgi:hypothetical protein
MDKIYKQLTIYVAFKWVQYRPENVFFLPSLKGRLKSLLKESNQSDEYFKDLCESDSVFETNLGDESGDQMVCFFMKEAKIKDPLQVYL